MKERERDIAIDIVKFLAVFLIINSHSDIMWPKFGIFATGGAIGDCLFLFCSGFTIFTGDNNISFDNYYKKRICRIYPSVFVSALFNHLISQNFTYNLVDFIGRPFVIAIMIYYILLFYLRKYACKKIRWGFILVAIISLVVYIFWFPNKYDVSSKGLYGTTTYYRWIPYFCAMLLGAYIGRERQKLNYQPLIDFVKLTICVIVFYGFQFGAKVYSPFAPWQILSLLPLMGITVYTYKCCRAQCLTKIYNTKVGNFIILFVGGLCLESYLIQNSLFTDKLNGIWPFNLIIIVVIILISSYFVRCFSRLFSQTFRKEDYEWKKIFSLL